MNNPSSLIRDIKRYGPPYLNKRYGPPSGSWPSGDGGGRHRKGKGTRLPWVHANLPQCLHGEHSVMGSDAQNRGLWCPAVHCAAARVKKVLSGARFPGFSIPALSIPRHAAGVSVLPCIRTAATSISWERGN